MTAHAEERSKEATTDDGGVSARDSDRGDRANRDDLDGGHEHQPPREEQDRSGAGIRAAAAPLEEAHQLRQQRDDLLFGIALFFVAFLLRFVAARWLAGEPVWDGHYYDFGARRIAEGHGYSDDRMVGGQLERHPWCHYPVGYSAYVAAFYWVFGTHVWVAHVANALSGALVSVVVFLLGREAFAPAPTTSSSSGAPPPTPLEKASVVPLRSTTSTRTAVMFTRARLAGALTALHPGLILYGALVMGEVLSALTVMVAFYVAIRQTRVWTSQGRRHAGLWGVAAGAFVLGIGALVRPQALLCAPFLALVLLPADANAKTKKTSTLISVATAAVLACFVALVPVLPWTARNCAVMDGCALVSTNAGWNLAIGSFPRATGRFETLRSSDGCREVTGQVQQDRCWLEYGLANIKAAPGRWIGLIPAKLSNTFDHESFAVEYLREARPTSFPEAKRVAWRTVLTALHRVLVVAMPLAFVALVVPRRLRRRRSSEKAVTPIYRIVQGALLTCVALAGFAAISADTPTFWPIVIAACVLAWLPLPGRPKMHAALSLPIVLIATTAITHAIFFGDDRYHMVITPALCLLAAAALRRPEPVAAE